MPKDNVRAKRHAVLGLRAQRGGAVAVGVVLERGEPLVVFSRFLATAEKGDRLAFGPYHVAAEMERGRTGRPLEETIAAVREGRKRQNKLAAKGLSAIMADMDEAGFELRSGVLLTNRAAWVDDLLAYSIAYADHPPVAEGLAVRDALRVAGERAGLALNETDEKSLLERACARSGETTSALYARLKALGVGVGRPWRKVQQLACLAAWDELLKTRRT